MKKLTALLVLLALGLLTNAAHAQDEQPAAGHPLVESIANVFERSQSDDLKEYGLDNSLSAPNLYNHSVKGCWLKKGEGKINTPTLEAGVEYAVIAGGDKHATKIKIQILDPGGQIRQATEKDAVITESTEDNNKPGVVFKLKKKQGAGIRIILEDTDGERDSGYVAFVLLRKDGGWDVPLENLKKAAANLEKKLEKVREANGNSADLAYAWFSIHGGVIPKGAASRNGHLFTKGTEYVVIAASDDNTDSLNVALNGIVRAPTADEQGDTMPTVTYTRNAASSFASEHTVKNPGETSIVLVAIVQIIKGS